MKILDIILKSNEEIKFYMPHVHNAINMPELLDENTSKQLYS